MQIYPVFTSYHLNNKSGIARSVCVYVISVFYESIYRFVIHNLRFGKKYGIDAVFALTKAEDVWRGIEKCLYGNGKAIHFSKYGELPCIRAKQINRGIPISVKDDRLQFKLGKTAFGIQVNDRFQQDEADAVLTYLAEPEIVNNKAVNTLIEDAYYIDT